MRSSDWDDAEGVVRLTRGPGFRGRSSATACGCITGFLSRSGEIELLVAERGVEVSYETIRAWCTPVSGLSTLAGCAAVNHMTSGISGEVFVKICGVRMYLWGAGDHGNVLDILIQSKRDGKAATRFFRKILKHQGRRPRVLVTDNSLPTRSRTGRRCRQRSIVNRNT